MQNLGVDLLCIGSGSRISNRGGWFLPGIFHLCGWVFGSRWCAMKPFRALSAAQQLSAYLRGEIAGGAWGGLLPGAQRLARELGVSPKTVMAAVDSLEREGVLTAQGARRRSRIVPHEGRQVLGLRVGVLTYESTDRSLPYMIDLGHILEDAGHRMIVAAKTLLDLKRDPKRVAAFVAEHPMDAWVVVAGSREILEWFAASDVPTFAIFGRRRGVALAGAGPDKVRAVRDLVGRLCALGHRRIVLIAREERRKPTPGTLEQAFLDALEAHGVVTGSYHLPDWKETPDGLLSSLDSLFEVTPPTALVLDEPFAFLAAQQHLARKGIFAPQEVSLACCDPDPLFTWMRPGVAHIRWDAQPMVSRVADWVEKVAHGITDRSQSQTKAEFVEGGTIAPPRR